MDGGLTARVAPARAFHADLRVPGDKSIAHRCLMLAAIATGQSRIANVSGGADVLATARCLESLGVAINWGHPLPALPLKGGGGKGRTNVPNPPPEGEGDFEPRHPPEGEGKSAWGNEVRVEGRGIEAWQTPAEDLQCANSGTTMRLLAGLLSGSRVRATLVGDHSLQSRPMDRVVRPLRRMGARITAHEGRAPLQIEGGSLTGVEHQLARPSAQVKSALLLAGLLAGGETVVVEPIATRDHTERLLRVMGAPLTADGPRLSVRRAERLRPLTVAIPGDFSSAAFLWGAAALRPGWSATIRGVGVNPSRTRFLDILRTMGAEVAVDLDPGGRPEPAATVTVVGRRLQAIDLGPDDVAQAIDEVPLVLAMATQAEGRTHVTGADELRVKESDRLQAMAEELRRLGARIEEHADGVTVEGPTRLRAAAVDAHGDHRIAMAVAVAALVADGPVPITGAGSVAISYPGFFEALGAAVA